MRHADLPCAPGHRVRRARRDDVPRLVPWVGGPVAGRPRALRRLQRSLSSDLYVLEREGALRGVVAVGYRRSLARGGLVATIDELRLLPSVGGAAAAAAPDLELLLDCALTRAQRRGCVSIDAAPGDTGVGAALLARGFSPAAPLLERSFRADAEAPAGSPELPQGEP